MNPFIAILLAVAMLANSVPYETPQIAGKCVKKCEIKLNIETEYEPKISSMEKVSEGRPDPCACEETILHKVEVYNFYTPHTEEDVILLAKTIAHEAGGQCREGQVAVANVVVNRIKHNAFPDTLYDVIYEDGQFSGAYYIQFEEPTEEMIEIARNVLEGREYAFFNNTSVLFFQNPGEGNDSDWGKYKFYQRIEDHVFYTYEP